MDEKTKAIEALDKALDAEIIDYAEKFAENPNVNDLVMLCRLVTVDMYADKYLEDMTEVKPATSPVMVR